MLITINKVEVTKAPKGYKIALVSFMKDGKEESRKILDFAAPAVFAVLNAYKDFPVDVDVTMKKNEKTGYWDWTDVQLTTKTEGNTQVNSKAPTKSGNWETAEERAARQVYIIKQSSISSAIELVKAQHPKGAEVTAADIVDIADKFKNYVLGVDVLDANADVPF